MLPVVSSRYRDMVDGNMPEELLLDMEGLQIIRTLGRKMAWLQKSIQAVKGAGVTPPETEARISADSYGKRPKKSEWRGGETIRNSPSPCGRRLIFRQQIPADHIFNFLHQPLVLDSGAFEF
jgi:hypothetical protein